jgi:cytochrome oxidase Cu insertion factor (SCO1/SenC/PrrC family)
MTLRQRSYLLGRSKRARALSLAVLTAVAVVAAVSCHWKLETRTPALDEKKVAPDFELPDHTGKTYGLDGLLAKGPAVVVFYRGYW